MTNPLKNIAITDITQEILGQTNISSSNLTRKPINANNEFDLAKPGKCNLPINLPTPAPKYVLQNVTNKAISYSVPIKAFYKKLVKPATLLELTNEDLSKINEPVYSDDEVGFGIKWRVNPLNTDDDHSTPRCLISQTQMDVLMDLKNALKLFTKLGVSKFNTNLKGYGKLNWAHN
jgi:hypothetical protein